MGYFCFTVSTTYCQKLKPAFYFIQPVCSFYAWVLNRQIACETWTEFSCKKCMMKTDLHNPTYYHNLVLCFSKKRAMHVAVWTFIWQEQWQIHFYYRSLFVYVRMSIITYLHDACVLCSWILYLCKNVLQTLKNARGLLSK